MPTHALKRYHLTFANESARRLRRRQELSKQLRTKLSRRRFKQQVQRALQKVNFSTSKVSMN